MASPDTDPTPDPTRRDIVDTARRLLVERGPGGLTVRRIAEEAGHSTMAVYTRFGGKDGVLDVLFAEGFTMLRDTLAGSGSTSSTGASAASSTGTTTAAGALDELRRQAQAYRDFARSHPRHYSLMFDRPVPGFEPSESARLVALAAFEVLAGAVRQAMSTGALAAGDPFATAMSAWAGCHGLVSLELADTAPPGVDWPAVYARTQDALLRGFMTDPVP